MYALAEETCLSGRPDQDRRRPITVEDVHAGEERLIVRRETHLDQLADKLQEGRVRRVIGPLLSGGDERDFSARDLEYVRDLGLVALDSPLRIANPVYAEVVPRRGLDRTIRDGLEQTAACMDRCAAEAWHLEIFDRDAAKSWDESVYHRVESTAGRDVHVWGM